jgi:hypothetical protein
MTSSPMQSTGIKRSSLQLLHPKKKALLSKEVIEILSSDEDEGREETVKVSSNTKPSVPKGLDTSQQRLTEEKEALNVSPYAKPSVTEGLETNQQRFTEDTKGIGEKRTGQAEEHQKMEVDVKTLSDTSVNKSEELIDADSSLAHERGESDSRMEAEKGSGLGKDESSDKEIPMLDPSTGLFVTDSDSQNSVYVANPENISFEDELMVEDD